MNIQFDMTKACGDNSRKAQLLMKNPDFFQQIVSSYDPKLLVDKTKSLLAENDPKLIKVLNEILDIYLSAEDLTVVEPNTDEKQSLATKPNRGTNSSLESYLSGLSGRVLLKPNIVSTDKYPETTDLNFLNDVICLIPVGVDYIAIGDGPSLFFCSEKPIQAVADYFRSIQIINFNKTEYTRISERSWKVLKTIEVPTILYEFDYIVSIANCKQHDHFGYSGARKNVMGLISPASRLTIHRVDDSLKDKAITELSDYFEPRLNIVDARQVMLHAQQRAYGGVPAAGPGILLDDHASAIDAQLQEYMRG